MAGQASPGARVKVAGHLRKSGRGRPLSSNGASARRRHELHVHATDVAGHVADEKSPRIVVDTKTDFHGSSPKLEVI